MAEFTLAHVGINGTSPEEARQWAEMFELLFGLKVKEGNSSFFAGGVVEVTKKPFPGAHGHIAIGTPDVPAAKADLESRGFTFDESTAKFRADGVLNAIYLEQQVGGFAIHLVGTSKG
jgi:2-dehydro-3-deoxyphosphogluconate aldolase/(4S)-4-hydroxy-2-oxoglutarate aldolase